MLVDQGNPRECQLVRGMTPGKMASLGESKDINVLLDELERAKGRIRSKVEHPFWSLKRPFEHARMRVLCGRIKNTARLFALANLWMMCKTMLQCADCRA